MQTGTPEKQVSQLKCTKTFHGELAVKLKLNPHQKQKFKIIHLNPAFVHLEQSKRIMKSNSIEKNLILNLKTS